MLSGRKPSSINPSVIRGTSLFDSLQWGAEPLSPVQKGLACPHHLSLLGSTPAEGPSWAWGNFSAESCSWHIGRSWKLSLTSDADCSLEVIPAWWRMRWVDEIQHCWELDGVCHVEYLHQILHSKWLFPMFHTCLVPHRVWDSNCCNSPSCSPEATTCLEERAEVSFNSFSGLLCEMKVFGQSCNPLSSCTYVCLWKVLAQEIQKKP